MEEIPCVTEDCEGSVAPARSALGYKTCLKCGSPDPVRTVAPSFNKGPYQLIPLDCVKDIGRS